jgi:hypothetical protein
VVVPQIPAHAYTRKSLNTLTFENIKPKTTNKRMSLKLQKPRYNASQGITERKTNCVLNSNEVANNNFSFFEESHSFRGSLQSMKGSFINKSIKL